MRLALTVGKWLTTEMEREDSCLGSNEWIEGAEGRIYIRYTSRLDQLDLSNFSIDERHQRKGVAFFIIKLACTYPIGCVRVENILNEAWGRKVREYSFEGRETVVRYDDGGLMSVDFIKE